MQVKAILLIVSSMPTGSSQPFTTRASVHFPSASSSVPFKRCLLSSRKKGSPSLKEPRLTSLTKVQHPGLTVAIAQLHYQLNTKGITFTVTANHLNSAISQTPDYQMAQCINLTNSSNRNRHSGGHGGSCNGNSGWGGCNGHGGGHGHGNNNNNNSSKVTPNASGFYPTAEWNKLSFKERDKIHKEHDKKGKPMAGEKSEYF